MKKRTQIEAELAQLALEIGGKTHSEAANAVLELYKNFALLAAEESIQHQLQSAQSDVEAQLRARIAELQGNIEVPAVPSPTPKETAPAALAREPETTAAAAPTTPAIPEEDDNQLSLVDVAEEIEKEEAAKTRERSVSRRRALVRARTGLRRRRWVPGWMRPPRGWPPPP